MSSNVPISSGSDITAPTPQNTPLTQAPISQGLSRPTVPDISEDAEPEEGAEIQQAMLGMVQGKLAGLLGKSSGYVENLPDNVKKSVEALKGVQVKQNELQNRYKHECLELEKKRRHELITGASQPTEEELKVGADVSAKDDPEAKPLDVPASTPAAAIPEFWLTALRNHVVLGDIITERDAGALKHLRDLRIEYLTGEDKPGFKLLFEFEPNEFFENTLLEKKYVYQEEVGYTGDFVYDRAIGCEIKWKEDKDLTKEFEIKKQRNKHTNRTRLVRKARPTESFFNFFSPPVPPSEDALESGDINEEDLDDLEEKLEMDYQIGEDIKEKASIYTSSQIPALMMNHIDYSSCNRLFHWQGARDDEDDDAPASRRGPRGRGAGAGNVDPQECKQQ
ncbi:hypothetical protein K488DRAFT_70632 [Vararia minispora EC-137]|uniref:Uncharacterized protein n=1 Tax=Vararia minispora EC-137 TaxID=1314806 RepID=A0ACB8QL02_9AGAM|nr:hypothetical protein K488DRAFT_70632 [Vararia minispora EC-137]